MISLIYIVVLVLSRKENYPEWSRKIKHTLNFNELWKGVCIGEGDDELEKPTTDKKIIIWKTRKERGIP